MSGHFTLRGRAAAYEEAKQALEALQEVRDLSKAGRHLEAAMSMIELHELVESLAAFVLLTYEGDYRLYNAEPRALRVIQEIEYGYDDTE